MNTGVYMDSFEVVCKECNRKYRVKIITYPSNVDEKRDSYYCCPYCESSKSFVSIRLSGREDVVTEKID